jgi:hypothetical protein
VTTYDLGDGVPLRYLATDRDGNPVAASVTLTITRPDGTVDSVATVATTLGQYDAATYVPVAIGDYTWKFVASGAITDVATGVFTVASQAPALYAELPAVKNQLGKITTDDRDEMIQAAILAASRMIDMECGLWPGAFRADAIASTRTVDLTGSVRAVPHVYGRPPIRSAVNVPAIASATGIVVSGGHLLTGVYATLPTGSFVTGPPGAPNLGEPIMWLGLSNITLYGIDSLQVTARWGWPTIPSQIEMATRLMAARLYRRKDSPQGVITSADWGAVRVSRTDPDVHALIFPFMTPGFA